MENGPVVLETVQTPLEDVAEGAAPAPRVHLLRGREAVAAMGAMLVELGHRTGQAGAMEWLDHLLDMPTSLQKIPYLALVGLDDGVNAAQATANDVQGAVLLYEYRVAGRGVKVFATDDVSGQRTVIAPVKIRTHVAQAVCRRLIDVGAVTVLITSERESGTSIAPEPQPVWAHPRQGAACRMATRTRTEPRYLPLETTLEKTLATLGKHTRRNLRYYRRRLETELGAVFVPSVEMGKDEFLDMNRRSSYPVLENVAAWRYDAIRRAPGATLVGVKGRDGTWLSLIGQRKHSQVTEIDWQMNLAGLPRHSLSTVMRSYVLEHEIQLGTRKLAFTGGTPHSIRHSFVSMDAVDMVMQRRCAMSWALRRLSRWILPEKNFLGKMLRDEQLRWIAC